MKNDKAETRMRGRRVVYPRDWLEKNGICPGCPWRAWSGAPRSGFPTRLSPTYFEQLISERKGIRKVAGQPRRFWERIPGRRAEALDCLVYALAVRQAFAPNFEQREAGFVLKQKRHRHGRCRRSRQ